MWLIVLESALVTIFATPVIVAVVFATGSLRINEDAWDADGRWDNRL